jgi:hypothetical protein
VVQSNCAQHYQESKYCLSDLRQVGSLQSEIPAVDVAYQPHKKKLASILELLLSAFLFSA